jgi:hypothetical protein
MKNHFLFSLINLLIIIFSTANAFSHEVADGKNHHLEDAYLAEKARIAETQGKVKVLRKQNLPIVNGINPAIYGEWSQLTIWPFAFASAANLPDGRILAWGGNNPFFFAGSPIIYTYAAIWDPVTNTLTEADHPTHSMFCGIPVMLEDGRVFVNGGIRRDPVSTFLTSTFDYRTNNWTQIESMAAGRWYPNTVALPNGQVFTAAGTPGSDYAEIWTEGLGWEYLSGVNILSAILNFPTWTEPSSWLPHLHLAPNGKIFHSGHTPEMHFIDPSDSGSIKTVDISNDWNTANIPGVLYE